MGDRIALTKPSEPAGAVARAVAPVWAILGATVQQTVKLAAAGVTNRVNITLIGNWVPSASSAKDFTDQPFVLAYPSGVLIVWCTFSDNQAAIRIGDPDSTAGEFVLKQGMNVFPYLMTDTEIEIAGVTIPANTDVTDPLVGYLATPAFSGAQEIIISAPGINVNA